MRITTLPVYSRLADEGVVRELGLSDKLPAGVRLSQHQVDTYRALTSGEYDVVINTAMTGDGKSLAAQLDTLAREASLMMMYPTNELVLDQEVGLGQTLEKWGKQGRIRATTLTGPRLREIVAAGLYGSKAQGIRGLAANNEIVLTNPDIFHYLAQFYYTRRADSTDMLFGRLLDLLDLLVFDEFHVFQAPQVVSALNAMLLIRAMTGERQAKRFLFLSATPGGLLNEYLERAGFRVKTIRPDAAEGYLHTTSQPDAAAWRSIIQGSDIAFDSVNAEAWVDAHLEDTLLPFFRANRPGAKGAIIVNSVAAAHRLVERLRGPLAAEKLTVLPNTGLTGAEDRKASRNADLLVGTSTVDVGVDFRINFLLFESRDAGTFLQRLGRLGRHTQDENGHHFNQYAAYALVPPFVRERLFDGYQNRPPCFADRDTISREQLSEAVRDAYPAPYDFHAYAKEWGWVQTANVYLRLHDKKVRGNYEASFPMLRQNYYRTFGIQTNAALARYTELGRQSPEVVEEAQSFRGGSPFDCGIVDETPLFRQQAAGRESEKSAADAIKRYDLFMLARNADLQWLGKEQFAAIAKARGVNFTTAEIDDMAGWFRLRGMTEPRQLSIRISQDLSGWGGDAWGEVRVMRGITLDLDYANEWLNDLNAYLRRREYVAVLCLAEPLELTKRLRLPPLFGLLKFVSLDGQTGAIAFAREALMLQTALKAQRFACGGGAIIC